MTGNPTLVIDGPSRVRIEPRERPVPGPGQLLIETTASLISTGTEVAIFDGIVSGIDYPFAVGYSNVGVVVATGPGVAEHWYGRKVATRTLHARYVVADDTEAVPIRESVSDHELVFFTLAGIALNGLRRAAVSGGEVATVFGLGVLGQLVVRLCRLFGLRPVIGVDPEPDRRKLLADHANVVTANPAEAEQAVAGATHGRMADVVFDVTGLPAALPGQARCARDQARLVLLGSPRGDAVPFDFYFGCHRPSLTIVGAHTLSHPPVDAPGSPWTVQRHSELFLSLVEDGELDVSELITDVVPWHESVTMFHELSRNRSSHMGVVLDWTSNDAD